ncbi:MAG TPA: Hpt domain-containing protein, partial [Allocoleopsis sp.]
MSVPQEDDNLFAEFLDDYFAECEEHLAIIRRNLLAIEPFVQQPEIEPSLVDELFRSFHSIKGLSGMVGVKEAEQLAHEMESYLRVLRDKQVLLASEGLDALIGGTKMLDLVIATRRQHQPLPDVTSVIAQLMAVLPDRACSENIGGTTASPEEAQSQVVETEVVASEAQAEEQSVAPEAVAPVVPENTQTISSDFVPLDRPNLPPPKLKPEESTRLTSVLESGVKAWRFVFIPEAALNQRGINVNNIRDRLQSIGEIVHASPQVTGNGGIAFNFIVATQADATTFASWREDGLTGALYEEEVKPHELPIETQTSETTTQEPPIETQASEVETQESPIEAPASPHPPVTPSPRHPVTPSPRHPVTPS